MTQRHDLVKKCHEFHDIISNNMCISLIMILSQM